MGRIAPDIDIPSTIAAAEEHEGLLVIHKLAQFMNTRTQIWFSQDKVN